MVLTESDSDIILVEPMKNRTSGEMIRAYQALIDCLHAANIVPKHHILDNECSEEFKATIKGNNMTYQLVPPHDQLRKPFRYSRTISLLFYAEPTRSSH